MLERMGNQYQLIFKGETITMVSHKKPSFIEIIFYGFTQTNEFRQAFEQLLSVNPNEFSDKKWLFDQKYMHVQPDDLTWAMDSWLPKAVQAFGKKGKVAIIPAVNFVGNIKVRENTQKIEQKYPEITIKFFDEYDDGVAWLS